MPFDEWLLSERNIKIALCSGAILLVLAGIIFIGSRWGVLIAFFGPFLEPWPSFSVGTDRLKDGLGIGVAEKVERALEAAAAADRVQYRFQMTNANGDLERDYAVTRVGDDYLDDMRLVTH